ncbi:hypothetical protein BOW53_00145 [Solemya pervernicosa gill symbiont]|uniref:Pilus assembly protein PilP n=1 Tax=Solemya pervernicosa gill symbiont TaxID=642797 RepID=A0A1T2LB45_9GAMM|nr:pilus assembly protein PilP [Solemya pervernicosa gill symbiont]OOZ42290.1 hypothetical protein BOW53_00145 [Solemya pervernicosa gill symbiont]
MITRYPYIKPLWMMALLSFFLLSGCTNNNMPELRNYAENIKARPGGAIEPLPQPKPYETFSYNAFEMRSPFQPEVEKEPEISTNINNGISPDPNRPRETLEAFSLDTLRMVGTLQQQSQLWALIKASDGTIHRVHKGNYLGRNHGKIIGVNDDSIELTEIAPDGLGAWVERPASLALSE